ncbi:MAG: acyltransferase [Geitlerinemataceae cyanobacterium]
MAEIATIPSQNDRDLRFDYLKVIGLLCIILAHTEPGDVIDQIRNFDVPLMVMVSGALFSNSAQTKPYKLKDYVIQRFWRLMAPVWCFFIFYFSFASFNSWMREKEYPYDWHDILGTFSTLDGIGYVWVIRVFLIIAVLSPGLLKLSQSIQENKKKLYGAIGIFLFYECVATWVENWDTSDIYKNIAVVPGTLFYITQNILIGKILFYAIAYSFVFLIGIWLRDLSRKSTQVLSRVFGLIFFILGLLYFLNEGEFIRTQDYKYPPQLYYLSYALFMAILLYLGIDYLHKKQKLSNRYINQWIVFISSSSLWVYLWHIFFLEYSAKNFLNIVILSIATTGIQKILISQIVDRTPWGRKNASLLKVLFLR